MKPTSSPTFTTTNAPNHKSNIFDFMTQNNTQSNNNTTSTTTAAAAAQQQQQQSSRYARTNNDGGTYSPTAAHLTTPKVRQNLQTKLTQPNAPDRSQSAHKKAMKSKPIIYHNEDNGLPRQRCYLSKEDTTTHHDVDAGTTTNNDESSVDSVSGEFRVTTTTTTTASTSTQYDYGDNNTHEFINNPLVVQRPHEEADNNNKNNKSWGCGGNHNEYIPLEDETFHSSSNQRRTSNGTHNSSCSRKFP